ncbi:timm16, partial [Symbiodinium sp. KB8]
DLDLFYKKLDSLLHWFVDRLNEELGIAGNDIELDEVSFRSKDLDDKVLWLRYIAIVRRGSAKIFLHTLPDKLTAFEQGRGGPLSLQELKDTMVSSKGTSRIAIGSVCHTDSTKAYKTLDSEESLPALYSGTLGGLSFAALKLAHSNIRHKTPSVAGDSRRYGVTASSANEKFPVLVVVLFHSEGDQSDQDDDTEVLCEYSENEMPNEIFFEGTYSHLSPVLANENHVMGGEKRSDWNGCWWSNRTGSARAVMSQTRIWKSHPAAEFEQVLEAYKEAAAGRGAAAAAAQKIARRRMSLDEAKKVLDADGVTSRSQIEERFQTLHSLNAPSEECPGSPYLQDRIAAAHKVVLENLETSNPSGQKAKPPEE